MTVEGIRQELLSLGMSQKELAHLLHIHPVTLGLILTGKNKLTPQLCAHIKLCLNQFQEQHFLHKIDLPIHIVKRWVPDFDELTEEQQYEAVNNVLNEAAKCLVKKGESRFSHPEQISVKDFTSRLKGMPTRIYVYENEEDEGRLIDAAEYDDD